MALPPGCQKVLEWPCSVAFIRRLRSDVAAAASSAIIKHHWQLYTLLFIMIIINGIVNPVTLPLPVERVTTTHPRPPFHAIPLVTSPEHAAKLLPQVAPVLSKPSTDASKEHTDASHGIAVANASTPPPATRLSFDTCLVDPPSGVSVHVIHERVPAYDVDEVDAHVLQVMSALKSMGHAVRLFAYAPHPRVGTKHTSRLRELGIPCAGPGCDEDKQQQQPTTGAITTGGGPHGGDAGGKGDAAEGATAAAGGGGQLSASRQLQEELARAQGPHVVVLAWLPHWSAGNKRKIADLGCLAHKASPPTAAPRRIILASQSAFLKLEKRTLRPAHSHERPVIFEPATPDPHDLTSLRAADVLLLASDKELLATSPHLPRSLPRTVVPPTLPLPPLPAWWDDARHSTRANVLFVGSGHEAEHVAALDWLEGHAMPALREGRLIGSKEGGGSSSSGGGGASAWSKGATGSALGLPSGADCWLRNVQLHVIGDGWERRMARQCDGTDAREEGREGKGWGGREGRSGGGEREEPGGGGYSDRPGGHSDHACGAPSGSVYLGRVSDDALILAMSHYRVMVLPLLHNGTQAVRTQVATLHAMAYGLPVVASSAAAQGLFLPQEAWRWHAVGGVSGSSNSGSGSANSNGGGRGGGKPKRAPLGIAGSYVNKDNDDNGNGDAVEVGVRGGTTWVPRGARQLSDYDEGSQQIDARMPVSRRRRALGWESADSDTSAGSSGGGSSNNNNKNNNNSKPRSKPGAIRPMKVPVLVRDDPDRFLQTVAAVYSEEKLWKAMARSGRHHVSLFFDPPLVRYPLTHALCAALAAPVDPSPCGGGSISTGSSVAAGGGGGTSGMGGGVVTSSGSGGASTGSATMTAGSLVSAASSSSGGSAGTATTSTIASATTATSSSQSGGPSFSSLGHRSPSASTVAGGNATGGHEHGGRSKASPGGGAPAAASGGPTAGKSSSTSGAPTNSSLTSTPSGSFSSSSSSPSSMSSSHEPTRASSATSVSKSAGATGGSGPPSSTPASSASSLPPQATHTAASGAKNGTQEGPALSSSRSSESVGGSAGTKSSASPTPAGAPPANAASPSTTSATNPPPPPSTSSSSSSSSPPMPSSSSLLWATLGEHLKQGGLKRDAQGGGSGWGVNEAGGAKDSAAASANGAGGGQSALQAQEHKGEDGGKDGGTDGAKEQDEAARSSARDQAMAAFKAASEAALAAAALHHVPAASGSIPPVGKNTAPPPPQESPLSSSSPLLSSSSPSSSEAENAKQAALASSSGQSGVGEDGKAGVRDEGGGADEDLAGGANKVGKGGKEEGDGDGKEDEAKEGGVDAVVVQVATFSKDDFAHAAITNSEGTMEVVDLDDQGGSGDQPGGGVKRDVSEDRDAGNDGEDDGGDDGDDDESRPGQED